ncbi:hypothetical protein BC332_23084 [Capsicum chinense]|nr:hypothetical protein BC332_23084 [Capsicum chinense]
MILNKRIPKAVGKRCMESMGWLITNIMNNVKTECPSVFIRKAVLSASPSHTSNFVLMVIEGDTRMLSFWRLGDSRWTRIRWVPFPYRWFVDMVYLSGFFYAVNIHGEVLVCDVADPEPFKPSHVVLNLPVGPRNHLANVYILESLGSLFVVMRYGVYLSPVNDDSDRTRVPLMHIPCEREKELEEEEEIRYGRRAFRVFHVGLTADDKVNVNIDTGHLVLGHLE